MNYHCQLCELYNKLSLTYVEANLCTGLVLSAVHRVVARRMFKTWKHSFYTYSNACTVRTSRPTPVAHRYHTCARQWPGTVLVFYLNRLSLASWHLHAQRQNCRNVTAAPGTVVAGRNMCSASLLGRIVIFFTKTHQQQPPFYGHCTGQPALAVTSI